MGFPHSDTYGSTLVWQLTVLFRGLLRPSSPARPKASTSCPKSLITLHSSSCLLCSRLISIDRILPLLYSVLHFRIQKESSHSRADSLCSLWYLFNILLARHTLQKTYVSLYVRPQTYSLVKEHSIGNPLASYS